MNKKDLIKSVEGNFLHRTIIVPENAKGNVELTGDFDFPFKVTQTVRREDKGAHRECPYCGAFYDAELENALGVTTAFRSASARSLRFA